MSVSRGVFMEFVMLKMVLCAIFLALHFNPTSCEAKPQDHRWFVFRKQCELECTGAGDSCQQINQDGYKWECFDGTKQQEDDLKFEGHEELEEELDEDEECYEFDCDLEDRWLCPSAKRFWIQDNEVPNPFPDRALHTIPDGFIVKTSGIPDAGLGMWTLQNISECIVIGPYGGEYIYDREESTLSYAYSIADDDGELRYLVDAYNPETSNWLRYINCALTWESANLEAVQYKGEMYYQTRREIPAGTELLVWYGDDYARYLGLI